MEHPINLWVIAGLLMAGGALWLANKQTQKKFSYSFFSISNFLIVLAALIAFDQGRLMVKSAGASGGSALGGLALLTASAGIAVALFVRNRMRTTTLVASLGTTVQLIVFGLGTYLALKVYLAYLLGAVFFAGVVAHLTKGLGKATSQDQAPHGSDSAWRDYDEKKERFEREIQDAATRRSN